MTEVPRILFVTPNHADYLSDGIFYGLRSLLGANVLDFPKAEYLYESASDAVMTRLRGHGFTLYRLLPDMAVDRDHVLPRAVGGEFDLVIFGDISRSFGIWTEWAPQLRKAGVAIAVLDGADGVGPFPYSGLWWRVRGWWFLPRAHNRARYFKRELTPWTRWFASYLLLPPPLGRRLGIEPIAFSIPSEKVLDEPPEKEKDFPEHVVDREVADRIGARTTYAFTEEAEYYDDLQRSRFGITVKRAGWDALRHYEIAANGAVPCFRNLGRKPASCAPFGLNSSNCVIYHDVNDLFDQLTTLSNEKYCALQRSALEWARCNTTEVRARQLMVSCGVPIPTRRAELLANAPRS